ncbi:fluoride efflux transporter CrcB [Actinomadura mexicana]|uniref:Fluoride-specific ion channel FluC n=1 Tax=Actinomadura mexicana TaxID=134959 RepID=A0A239DY97_9ACTN|nr:fluoride efflux transporter CrcB [Actinomadura mexicana]SNS37475.1 CrcB protein [Actinomadura mexicana]
MNGRPVDSDVDLHVPRQRSELREGPWGVLAAIAAGGALGALARYGLGTAFPHRAGEFPWAVFWVNVSGCLLIGVLMVLITETWRAHRLVRPFLGVGVLGGFTTFSTYVVDVQEMVDHGAPLVGLAYLAGTLAAALTAVYAGVRATRLLARPGRREAVARTRCTERSGANGE